METRKATIRCQLARPAISVKTLPLFVGSLSVLGLVLTPVAVLAGALGAWRLGADPGWTSNFFIADGLLSVTGCALALAIGAQTSAFSLKRWVANQHKEVSAIAL